MMLFYAVIVLFIFLVLLLWHRMQSSFMAAFKMSVSLFAFSIPSIVLLFLVFPRISFETKDFGFKASETVRTGHDGLMHIGGDALLVPSKRVVMEVSFDSKIPPSNQLYFRGSTLYVDKTSHWAPLTSPAIYLNNESIVDATPYQVTLYPHHKKWLYFLDYPLQAPEKAQRDSDYIVTAKQPVTDVMRYSGYSNLDSALHVRLINKEPALVFDAKRDDKLFQYMQQTPMPSPNRLEALIKRFKALNLSYSLQPKEIDEKDPIDSFVFGNRQGYCVHFASTFATMARMMGIPSRIVTGFKANPDNSYENYIMIREEDAHAWVEVYSEDVGWQRIETTQYAVGVQANTSNQNTIQPEITHPFWHRINLTYMYLRYTLQSWVLDYNRSKQMQLLRTLLEDVGAVVKFVAVFMLLGVLGFLLRQLQHHHESIHPALQALKPLLKRLEKKGFVKEESESMEHYLRHCANILKDQKLLHVSRLYHHARYADNEKALSALHVMIKTI
jgi:transglutaminase-like putative cysteine protease